MDKNRGLSLDELAYLYGTDKGLRVDPKKTTLAPKNYAIQYERFFRPIRHKKIKLLEIGIGKGGSLLMWRDFFPEAQIVGADISADAVRKMNGLARIKCAQLDQSDPMQLGELVKAEGPFDVIIDDGGHTWKQQITSFEYLFLVHKAVAPGGFYSIEDLATSYRDFPPFNDYAVTTMDFLKLELDFLMQNNREYEGVYFFPGLVIIEAK